MVRTRVIIYARVSTPDQSCDRQIADLTAWAKRKDYELVAVYKETASGAKDSRPIRRQVIAGAKAGYCDRILVTELTRWGRSTLDLIQTLTTLDHHGCHLDCLTGQSFDLSTAQGRLILSVLSALAQFERELIAERVKSGIAYARSQGKRIGRRKGDAPTCRDKRDKVFADRSTGMSIRSIAYKHRISPTTVQKILATYPSC